MSGIFFLNVSFFVCGINKDLVLSCLVLSCLAHVTRLHPLTVRGADIPDYFLRIRSGRSHA